MALMTKPHARFYLTTLFITFLLTGCGGSGSSDTPIDNPPIINEPAPLVIDDITYNPWPHSELTVYISDQSLTPADNPLMQALISDIKALSEPFAVHLQPWLIHLSENSPTITTKDGYLYLPINSAANDSERQTQLLSQLMLTKRQQLQTSNTPLQLSDVLISQALAHLIAEQYFDLDNQYHSFSTTQDDFTDLKAELTEPSSTAFNPDSRWLIGDTTLAQGSGIALMQHALLHTIKNYPGSDLVSISTLPLDSFLPFLTKEPNLLPQVSDVRLRTPDISEYDQVPASEMHQLQQAHSSYYLHGLHTKKEVALSFDDGPSAYTAQVLEVLAKHQIHATFFVLGQNIQNRNADLIAIDQQGHLIGNHSYRHTDSSTISDNGLLWQNEIANTNDIIYNLIGYAPRLFRPPYGRIRGDQIDYLTKRGMRTINWSIDTRDWHTQVVNQQDIEFAASHYSHPEAVILMHDGGGNRSNSVAALDKIINHYKSEGYRFVTLDVLFGIGRAR
ncbi:polysaccharide deacetylase family protein [Pseudoalteromonas tunicata]|uniref:polysaccharide deacetylase family protein n=1 Tax=Pseudoalteromonas tunicata TaxID=314281 RepID=UPI00273EF6AE|nr:polysaccharide deacetylase family protein [Pseudoalteromonas tunicata]MDP5214529.1 polysaccharide deacetylase family protein [Pseudoalteromonas tunicata]